MTARAFANGIWFTAQPAQQLVDYYGDEEVQETDECKGCVFQRKPASACKAAGAAAVEAGLPNCESRPDKSDPGYVYQKLKSHQPKENEDAK